MHFRVDVHGFAGTHGWLTEEAPTTALVFVHGFFGDAVTTWQDFQGLIDHEAQLQDFSKLDLYFYDFASDRLNVQQVVNDLSGLLHDVVLNLSEHAFRLGLGGEWEWLIAD